MSDFLLILLSYLMGVFAASLMLKPMKNWHEGYDTAKEYYGNWNLGFTKGWDCAKKLFKDYDKGFGDGFESGFNAALEREGER